MRGLAADESERARRCRKAAAGRIMDENKDNDNYVRCTIYSWLYVELALAFRHDRASRPASEPVCWVIMSVRRTPTSYASLMLARSASAQNMRTIACQLRDPNFQIIVAFLSARTRYFVPTSTFRATCANKPLARTFKIRSISLACGLHCTQWSIPRFRDIVNSVSCNLHEKNFFAWNTASQNP